MNLQGEVASSVRLEQLAPLHDLTKEVAKLFRSQLRTYLDALGPLFRPRRILGDFVEGVGKESSTGAEQNLAELRDLYSKICTRPFDLRRELPTPIESISTQIQICEWEYLHEAQGERETRNITVISPLSWVILYPSTYTLSILRQAIVGKNERNQESVRAFVLRACMMSLLFAKQPALKALLEGLRYRVEVRNQPQLGNLPLITLTAAIRTVRPADDLVLITTGLAGRPVFQEFVEPEAIKDLQDPLKSQLEEIQALNHVIV